MRIWLCPPYGSDLWGFINLGTGKAQPDSERAA